MSKKFIVRVIYGHNYTHLREMLSALASTLYRSRDIPIMAMDYHKCEFETPNCIVRYVNAKEKLVGLRADEIFGCDPEDRVRCIGYPDTEPYAGTILDYILEVEKAAAGKIEECDTGSDGEYDILEYLDKIMGLKLSDWQKETVKKFNDRFFKGECKVVYGRGGKIHAVPVDKRED